MPEPITEGLSGSLQHHSGLGYSSQVLYSFPELREMFPLLIGDTRAAFTGEARNSTAPTSAY
jgi:hypothetical protein